MPRNFVVASSENIVLGLGAGASVSGAYTITAIVRTSSDGGGVGKSILAIGSVNSTVRSLGILATNQLSTRSANANQQSTTTVLTADGFCFVAVSKAAGTATPRFHIQKYAAGTAMVHENAAGTLGDSTPSTSSLIARNQAAGSAYMPGDIAICAAYAAVLTDAQLEAMAYGLNAWWQVQPNGLWILDQSDVAIQVVDRTGGGANQTAITGTTVGTVSVPVFTYGARVRPATRDTGIAPLSLALSPVTVTATPAALGITVGGVNLALSPASVTLSPSALALTPGNVDLPLSPVTLTLTPSLLGLDVPLTLALSPVAIQVLASPLGLTMIVPRDLDWYVGVPRSKWSTRNTEGFWSGGDPVPKWRTKAPKPDTNLGQPEV